MYVLLMKTAMNSNYCFKCAFIASQANKSETLSISQCTFLMNLIVLHILRQFLKFITRLSENKCEFP
ncbi:hypothetical protein T12_223 [Trichinella patagoniensis]|uniref:Uncharacterized protein n=1 Tax=Trichinella patagoniensis TaxID=990121 RepID=A0A0V0ZMR2_9BILA|nr:hypothetical protein T12_223 [Trichinella patagoniensis]